MSPAACCLLPAAYCLLPAYCLPTDCCLLPIAACCMLPAACCLLPAVCCQADSRQERKEKSMKEKKRKVYAIGRHDGSLCHQKQAENLVTMCQIKHGLCSCT